jgi:hypothetical protein
MIANLPVSNFRIPFSFAWPLLLSALLSMGCKPVISLKKTFHGLYSNGPRTGLLESTQLRFLPESRFVYDSDNECTMEHAAGVGAYKVQGNKLVLNFGQHPKDQNQNYRIESLSSADKDSITLTCVMNKIFKEPAADTVLVDMPVEIEIPWGNIRIKAKSADGTVTFKLPKNTVQEWGLVSMYVTKSLNYNGCYVVTFPIVRDSSRILIVNGMNYCNTRYYHEGEGMAFPIRRKFSGGYSIGDLNKRKKLKR